MNELIAKHITLLGLWGVVILIGIFIVYHEAKMNQKNQQWLEAQMARIENKPLLHDYWPIWSSRRVRVDHSRRNAIDLNIF